MTVSPCRHVKLACVNPYDFIRKYRCTACCEVMMCRCDEEFARRFLSHEVFRATELHTQDEVRVTLGFVDSVCNTCRGLPGLVCPKAETYGCSSKIRRYYWREIFFEVTRRYAKWLEGSGASDAHPTIHQSRVRKRIEKEVVEEFKALHEASPKYLFDEESQSEVLEKHGVETLRLSAVYGNHTERRAVIVDGKDSCSAEQFATRYLEREGFQVIETESIPFHCLFGVYMWQLVQDPDDPKVRVVAFGERGAFEKGVQGELIYTQLPSDFGSPGYAVRRAAAIPGHFTVLDGSTDNLLWLFDYWIEPSSGLRQYLWAHRKEDVETARQIVSVLPADVIRRILAYLVGDYWKRFCGWPDLLAHRPGDYLFAEVKSSKDKLSEDQKTWIRGNSTELHLPFKLIKIHRQRVGPPTAGE